MVPGWIQKSLFCLLLLQISYGSGGQKKRKSTKYSNLAQVHLLHSLLDGYEKDLRPVKHWENGTTVYIDITIYSIFSADEKNQLVSMYFLYNRYWTDEFLTWNALEYDNITVISLPSNIVWVPDVLITEFVSSETPPFRSFVYIDNTGLVNYQKPLRISSMCIFYIYYFPFDQQNCTLTFQSQLHTVKHINVSMQRRSEEMKKDLQKFYDKGEWELLSINSNYKVVDELGRKFGVVEYYISFRRHPMYYIVNLIIPSAFLILMDIIGFYLPPESGERVTFKITLLLGYSVFLIVVSETLPASSQGAPIIEVYFVVCMALLVLSLIESICIVHIVNKENIPSKVPKWIKKLVLEYMTILLCIKEKKHYFQPNINSSDTLQMTASPSTDELSKYCENGGNFKISTPTLLIKETPEILQSIFNEIVALRQHLEKKTLQENINEWLSVGYVLDKFIFWVYVATILTYIASLSVCWSYHYISDDFN